MAYSLADLDALMMMDKRVTDRSAADAVSSRDGHYVAAPNPLVIGQGLASIPVAMEAQKNGVSTRKIVVSI